MASIGDGMTRGLKDAIKAKHKLVEQMKEEVVHPEDHKQNNLLWKIIIVTSSILLLFLAVHQMATAERASRGTRSDAQKLNKLLDPNLSLVREEGKRWTSERLLRHFGLRRASQLRWTKPVYTQDELWEAVQDPATHVITVEVAYSVVQKRNLKGLTWVSRPIIQTSSYVTLAPDGMDFDQLLRAFINYGSKKGLHIVFRDPRVVEPVMAALDVEMDYGRLKSPLILEAEILPGPEGYLPEMACVMTNPAAYPGGYPPRSVKASQIASLKDGTVVPFDPMTFVASAFKHVPGAILSLGVATHSTCTNEEPIEAPESAVPGTMTEEQAAAILEAGAAGSPQSGPDMQLAGVITETAKLLDGSAVVVEGGALKAAGVNEINPAAGGGKKKKRRLLFQRDGGGEVDRDGSGGEGPRRGGEQQKPLRQRRLTQLDSLNPGDGDATSALASKLAEDAVEMVLMGNEGMSPHGYGEFEVKAAAETLTLTKGYSWDTGRDLVEALKNGSWTGEVYFPISGCVMTESKKGYVRELLNTKLGWAVILRGAVLFNKELRASLLEELDTSRTFMGFDFVQLPNGEPLTEREVFVQPVLEDAAAMEGLSDEGKDAAAKFAKEYKQRNPGMGK